MAKDPVNEEETVEKVTVDKREIRKELGLSPGLPQDTYADTVHLAESERIYGVPGFVLAGALSYMKQQDPENYIPDRLTIDSVRAALNKYQSQSVKE